MNVDTSESLLGVADMVTSSSLEEGLCSSFARSLATFIKDPKWAGPVAVAGILLRDLRLGFVWDFLETGISSSQLESSMN